jgi:hypothetical protein
MHLGQKIARNNCRKWTRVLLGSLLQLAERERVSGGIRLRAVTACAISARIVVLSPKTRFATKFAATHRIANRDRFSRGARPATPAANGAAKLTELTR